jgi:hydrogenase nickel incorporation protein HypB
MCVVCGCETGAGPEHTHTDDEAAGASHVALTSANGDLHYGTGAAHLSVP